MEGDEGGGVLCIGERKLGVWNMQNGDFIEIIDVKDIDSWNHLVCKSENKKIYIYLNGDLKWE